MVPDAVAAPDGHVPVAWFWLRAWAFPGFAWHRPFFFRFIRSSIKSSLSNTEQSEQDDCGHARQAQR